MDDTHAHRFGQTWWGESGFVLRRWCVDCNQWIDVQPIPMADAAHFPRER